MNNEAIGILAIVVETAKGRCFVTDEAISDAYNMAIDALEKQIPVKPVKSKEERCGMGYEYHDWVCPSCGRFLAPEPARTGNHHCKCGQAIDWEDD